MRHDSVSYTFYHHFVFRINLLEFTSSTQLGGASSKCRFITLRLSQTSHFTVCLPSQDEEKVGISFTETFRDKDLKKYKK